MPTRTTFLDGDRNEVEPRRAAFVVTTVTDEADRVLYETWDRVVSSEAPFDTAAALAEIRALRRRPPPDARQPIGFIAAALGVFLSAVSIATNRRALGIAGIVLIVAGLVILVTAPQPQRR